MQHPPIGIERTRSRKSAGSQSHESADAQVTRVRQRAAGDRQGAVNRRRRGDRERAARDRQRLGRGEAVDRIGDVVGMNDVCGDVDRDVVGRPGTLSVLQFAAVSQLLSPPLPVQVTAESRVLGSIAFDSRPHDLDRFGLRFDCERNGSANMVVTSKTGVTREKRSFLVRPARPLSCNANSGEDPSSKRARRSVSEARSLTSGPAYSLFIPDRCRELPSPRQQSVPPSSRHGCGSCRRVRILFSARAEAR